MNSAESIVAGKPPIAPPPLDPAILRKVAWRLLPFLGLLYLVNILDRMNAGFGRLTMQPELGISDAAFDLGYGLFYFGYLTFEVPANLLMQRIGARRWMARILISWGLVSCATLAVTGPWSFYAVRILLGVAEAGFFPGIVLYLTAWFPARERARAMAWFMIASPGAGIVGYPISGYIMSGCHGALGLSGWQWLFLLEGIPAVLLGVIALYYLPDSPSHASWLSAADATALTKRLHDEDPARRQRHAGDFLRAVLDLRVWLLICIYFTVAVGSNASGAYFPKLIKDKFTEEFAEMSAQQIGILSALPSAWAVVCMIILSRHSDRTGERRGHLAVAAFMGGAGWLLALIPQMSWFSETVPWLNEIVPTPWIVLAGFCVAQAGMLSMLPLFWTLPTTFLSGMAAAGGIALINSVANIGGLLGPSILREWGLPAMAIILGIGGVLALCARTERRA
jgi:ACS family tartrate transporter-like MFS transporter